MKFKSLVVLNMSGSFTGFSEDDIRKLSSKRPEEIVQLPVKGKSKLKAAKRVGNNLQTVNSNSMQNSNELRSKILQEKIQNFHFKVEPIPESAKLSKPPTVVSDTDTLNCDKSVLPTNAQKHPTAILSSTQYADELRNAVKNLRDETVLENNEQESQISDNLYKNNIVMNTTESETEGKLSQKKLDLDEFQARQKLMEEQNRKRKELLAQALAVRTKQTLEETQKLNEIREEFKKLDALLSNDVKMLRQQIEVASLDYMEAQKRYFKIEKEFLDAKINLHQKLERKEMLTEHLCAIIEKNEERKADKLNELLLKLNFTTDVQEDVSVSSMEKSDDTNENKEHEIPEIQSITESTGNQNVVNEK